MATKVEDADLSIPLHGQYGYQKVHLYQSEKSELGRGSYGRVVRAKLDDLPCAAKILHENFFNSNDPAARDFATRFQQECHILRDLKHPNIVQFLGVVQEPRSGNLILLMEIMKESLTNFLELSTLPLPFHVQVNISQDIALAISHLHRNRILHRDLSSNNVLLTGGCQAKVTDFGMSKIADSNPSMTRSRVTQCPGTLVYMPPEALLASPCYSEKLDTFSMGVLIIEIITRKFPSPTKAQVTEDDPRSPTGQIIVPVSEVVRRKEDMSGIPLDHALRVLAIDCLKDRYQQRPDATQLCQSIATLTTTPAYQQSAAENPDLLVSLSTNQAIIRRALEHAVQSMMISETAKSELHGAAERGDVQEVQRLLTTSVNVNSITEGGGTPLHLASRSGHVAIVRLLIEAGGIVDLQNKKGRTALLEASLSGNSAVVTLLLQMEAAINICEKDGISPVYAASQNAHVDVVDLLLKAKADVHLATKKSDSVPLGVAANNGHTGIVQMLLDARAYVDHRNKDGQTPLLRASLKGHVTTVRLLLERRASVNICEKDGISPVFVASKNGHRDVVELLVHAGADIRLADPVLL